ncbi:MAG TPA: hypothetical protein VK279_14115 [Solirubrobacteraceae bacterium]|nr:hypothetical protein [Solirubrobacteraceae bacterium]
MYQFSRAIYRAVAADVQDGQHGRVLDACERMVERLAEGHRPPRPAKRLFADVRPFVSLDAQCRAFRTIQTHLAVMEAYVARQAAQGLDAFGEPLPCRSTTRGGQPCRRRPVDTTGYCPSHRHLAAGEVELAAA